MLHSRYSIALIAGCLILGCGVTFYYQVRRSVVNHFRDVMNRPENAAAVTPEMKQMLEDGIVTDFGGELPQSLMSQIMLADILFKFRHVWTVLVFVGCLSVAYLVKQGPKLEKESSLHSAR